MPHFFVDSALILVGILGLLVIALMLFSYRSNLFVNIYLVIIFTFCSVRNIIIGLFGITNSISTLNPKLISPIFLVAVPSLFLYFKSLVKDYERIHKTDFIHLIYPALNLLLNIGQVHFHILESQTVENIRFISLMAFFLLYLILSFNILYQNLWNGILRKSVAITHYLLIKNWTLFIFIISAFLIFRIIFSIYSEKISNELFQAHNYSFLVIIPWLLIYGKIFINPEILYGYPKLKMRMMKIQNEENFTDHVWIFDLKDISNAQDKKLSGNIKERVVPYISEIENFVGKEHPFRNPKFTFADFAKALNIPNSHLYYIFKYHAIVSFIEYKNYCRIKDALQLINEGALNTITLEALANKIGFISYNSFFTAFKKQTKLAPKDYLTSKYNMGGQDVNVAF